MYRRNFVKASIVIIITSVLGFYFCDKSDTNPGMTSNNSQYLTAKYLQQSKWKISKLNKNGEDATNQFSGYVLSFYNNGIVNAIRDDSEAITGSWSTSNENNNNNIRLNFNNASVFSDLSKEWQVTELLVNRVRIQSISRGHIGMDDLIFEAI